jgi:hypothetical protein
MDFLDTVNDKAQQAFRAMLRARDEAGHWTQPEVDTYVNSERDLDWERAKARMDAMQSADHDYHLLSGIQYGDCAECQEASAAMWDRMSR